MFLHNDFVTLTDPNGIEHKGALHLPDIVYTGPLGRIPQRTTGGYGVYTIIRPDGGRFRTEGRLS